MAASAAAGAQLLNKAVATGGAKGIDAERAEVCAVPQARLHDPRAIEAALCVRSLSRPLPCMTLAPCSRQLEELAALGIKGKTPGGTKWRTKAHSYNLRSNATKPAAADEEIVKTFKI